MGEVNLRILEQLVSLHNEDGKEPGQMCLDVQNNALDTNFTNMLEDSGLDKYLEQLRGDVLQHITRTDLSLNKKLSILEGNEEMFRTTQDSYNFYSRVKRQLRMMLDSQKALDFLIEDTHG